MGAAWEVEKHGQERSVCGEGEGQDSRAPSAVLPVMDMEHKKCIFELLKWTHLERQETTSYVGR